MNKIFNGTTMVDEEQFSVGNLAQPVMLVEPVTRYQPVEVMEPVQMSGRMMPCPAADPVVIDRRIDRRIDDRAFACQQRFTGRRLDECIGGRRF